MRNLLLVVLAVAAICYYFDISPTDFLPTVKESPHVREKRGAPEQTAPAQASATSAPTANNNDGSLNNRWKP